MYKISKLEIKTIILNSLYSFGANLVGNFVNVYLYVYADSFITMSIYTFIRILCYPFASIIALNISKKKSFSVIYGTGLFLIVLSLLYALFATQLFISNIVYLYLAAILSGFGEGIFYFAVNSCNQLVSTLQSRSYFYAYGGIFGNIVSIIAPLIATAILSNSINELNGYKKILLLIIIVFTIVFFISLTINVRAKNNNLDLNKMHSFSDEIWAKHNIAMIFYGLNSSIYLSLTGILLFNAINNNKIYSRLSVVFAIVSVISNTLISKIKNTSNIFRIGSFIRFISILVLLFVKNIYGAVFFGVVNAIASVLYENSYNITSGYIIDYYISERTGRIVTRETYLTIGRCLGLLFIILCNYILGEKYYLHISVCTLSIFGLFVEKIFSKSKKLVKINEERE